MRRPDLNSHDAVRDALKALADADATRHASPHVERALLDAFDRQRARSSSLSVWHALTAAVVLVLLVITVDRTVFERPPAPPAVSRHLESEMIGQTVHLRLPRSALPLFGIPIVDPGAEGTVNVELVLSEDGQTTAIRIVQ